MVSGQAIALSGSARRRSAISAGVMGVALVKEEGGKCVGKAGVGGMSCKRGRRRRWERIAWGCLHLGVFVGGFLSRSMRSRLLV